MQEGLRMAVGTERGNPRVTTTVFTISPQQAMFARGVLDGKTQKQAYRAAYPNDHSTDRNICVTANRLRHSPKLDQFIQQIDSAAQELLIDERKATRRYVFRELFALSKQAKQDRHKIKALELLGKTCGLFKPVAQCAGTAPAEKTLTDLLNDRLRLL